MQYDILIHDRQGNTSTSDKRSFGFQYYPQTKLRRKNDWDLFFLLEKNKIICLFFFFAVGSGFSMT